MARTPIDTMMDQLEWTQMVGTPPPNGELHATHEGVLEIGDLRLRCYRLSDGQAVIDADDFETLLAPLMDAA